MKIERIKVEYREDGRKALIISPSENIDIEYRQGGKVALLICDDDFDKLNHNGLLTMSARREYDGESLYYDLNMGGDVFSVTEAGRRGGQVGGKAGTAAQNAARAANAKLGGRPKGSKNKPKEPRIFEKSILGR